MKNLKLAYRNIWRNKRRAFITIASVLFAVFFCSVMNSYMDGMWNRMIDNTLRTQSGHIAIHGTGYWDDKTVDNFLTMDSVTIEQLRALPNVENLSPRVETFALVSLGNVSKGVSIMGVSPVQENGKSNLASHIVRGSYLSENDNGVLLGEGLAKYLKADVGDTLAFIGQGHYGASAAGLFPIRGILHLILPEMDNGLVYITLPAAQQFVDLPDGYSGILITLKDDKQLEKSMLTVYDFLVNSEQLIVNNKNGETTDKIEKSNNYSLFTTNYSLYSWHFTLQNLLQSAESDKAIDKIILFILYLIVGFGILGTVVMLTNERQREFRTMVSLGMSRRRLQGVVTLELLIMTFLGLISGLLLTLPVAFWFHAHPIIISGDMAKQFLDMGMEPIIPFSVEPKIFISQIFIVLILTAIAVIYPIHKISKMGLTNR
ncbi:MAG: hypothetical protein EZS26_002150 [Candidatus Ordinivivax streblomastigis]|uniref:ABC3 transporter permease protein domain-containing protein n=1 Tax=Candidatus Ordinivivax streblomastigis TaxID=2540710 RepID=A0A5M8NZT9_9BACT|nr:MAG: hypothetical protein EZS26_002150 [Candidatus Ordinivivax streblomastigis]